MATIPIMIKIDGFTEKIKFQFGHWYGKLTNFERYLSGEHCKPGLKN